MLTELIKRFIYERANKKELIALNNAAMSDTFCFYDDKKVLKEIMQYSIAPDMRSAFFNSLDKLAELKADEVYIYDDEKIDGYSFKIEKIEILKDMIYHRASSTIHLAHGELYFKSVDRNTLISIYKFSMQIFANFEPKTLFNSLKESHKLFLA